MKRFFQLFMVFFVLSAIISCQTAVESSGSDGGGGGGGGNNDNFTDKTAPLFSESPALTDIGGTSFTVTGKVNENGKVYCYVAADGAAAPDSASVKSGTGSVCAFSSNVTANTAFSIVNSNPNLVPATAYDVYVIAEDGSGNCTASPVKLDVTMGVADTTAPLFTSKSVTPQSTSATVAAVIDENGSIYAVVVASGSAAPTADEVKSGSNYGSTIVVSFVKSSSNSTSFSLSLTGLTGATAYDVYVVAGDDEASPNLTSPEKFSITTLSADSQSWTDGKLPYVNNSEVVSTIIKAYLSVTKVGKMYGVVVASGAAVPSAAQVKAGQDGSGTALAATFAKNYSITSSGIDTYKYLTFTGLTAQTTYDLYFTADNASGVCIEPVYKVTVTTSAPDMVAPEWTAAYPKIDTITSSGFKLYSAQSKIGNIYGVVVLSGSGEPTLDQIKSGKDSTGAAAKYVYTKTVSTANTSYYSTISTLTSNTAYDVYLVGASEGGALMASSTKLTVTTLSAVAAFSAISPAKGAVNVALTSNVTLTFTESLDAAVKGTVTFNGTAVDSSKVTVSGKTIVLDLDDFAASTTYTGIEISGFKDSSANALSYADAAYSFTTGTGAILPASPVFTGSDMETDMHDSNGLKPTGTEYSSTVYKNGVRSLHVSTAASGSANGYIFSSAVNCSSKGSYTKITFYIKGTASAKSLSINYGGKFFNLGTIADNAATISTSSTNSYTGSLSFADWTKITLDISALDDAAITAAKMSFKFGSGSAYDIYIDDIMYE